MKFSNLNRVATACAIATVSLGGCVVAPVGYDPAYGGQGYAPPAGVVYVAPTYVVPGSGYAWHHHSRFGWGWRHPRMGWHRGWR